MTDIIKEIRIFKDIDGMTDFAIEKWDAISEKEIQGKGCFTVALSGGKTPLTLYQKLSEKKTSFIKFEKDFYNRIKDRLDR